MKGFVSVSVLVLLMGCARQSTNERANTAERVGVAQQGVASACVQSPSAANCDGLNPILSGCAPTEGDATTLGDPKQVGGWWFGLWATGYLEQRYSPRCQTRWTRFRTDQDIQFQVIVNRVNPSRRLVKDGDKDHDYTNMVYAPIPGDGDWSGVVIGDEKTTLGPVP